MTPPKLSLMEVQEIVKSSGIRVPEAVMVLALRGYYLNSMGEPGENDRGIYDDAMILIGPNYFKTFNANTDPSRQQPGIATLCLGLHYFKKGKHGLSRPGGGYDAFRPATADEGLPVHRDGQSKISRGIAINIHSGGDVNTGSAGCQTLHKAQWHDFQTKAYELMTKESQHLLPYLLGENIGNGTYRFQE